MKVTLKDIAKACNVSFSTVSKALKNSPEISDSTIKFITDKALEMGYHPNAAARALRTNRSYNIGVIFEDVTGSGLQHQYFARIFDSINETANKADYDITFLSHSGKQNYLAQAKYRGCDGIIIASASYRKNDIKTLLNSDIPICTLDKTVNNMHPSVVSDNRDGFSTLMEYILQKGHRKIAYIHGEPSDVTTTRLNAFKAKMKKYNIEIPKEYLVSATYHMPKSTQDATNAILSLKDRPTCIVYPDDFSALGGIDALIKSNITPGKDISIAGYDGIFLANLITPKLTTYEQNTVELGRQMVKQLLANIESPDAYFTVPVQVKGHFIEGESVVDINNA